MIRTDEKDLEIEGFRNLYMNRMSFDQNSEGLQTLLGSDYCVSRFRALLYMVEGRTLGERHLSVGKDGIIKGQNMIAVRIRGCELRDEDWG